MNRYKSLFLVCIAVVLAGLAGFLAMAYLEEKEEALARQFEDQTEYVKIIVPQRPLAIGDVISADTVVLKDVPSIYVPDGAFLYEDFNAIAGMTVTEPVSEGRPLLRAQIEGLSGVAKFSQLLKPGQRALTVPVTNLDSNAYMLVPGDVVDVVLVTTSKTGTEQKTAVGVNLVPILDQAIVLATGVLSVADPMYEHYNLREEGYRTITVGVDVEDIPSVIAAKEAGELRYLLRNPEDTRRLTKFGSDQDQLRGVTVFSGKDAKNGVLQSQFRMGSNKPRMPASDDSGRDRVIKKYSGSKTTELVSTR